MEDILFTEETVHHRECHVKQHTKVADWLEARDIPTRNCPVKEKD